MAHLGMNQSKYLLQHKLPSRVVASWDDEMCGIIIFSKFSLCKNSDPGFGCQLSALDGCTWMRTYIECTHKHTYVQGYPTRADLFCDFCRC